MLRNTCARRRAVLTGMLSLCLCVPARSQGSSVRGEIKSGSPQPYSEFLIQIEDPTHRNPDVRVEVRGDGGFEIRNLAPGDYVARVTTLHGEVLHEQNVVLTPHGSIEIRMPAVPVIERGARTVSMKQLLHPPSKKAIHSFVAAQKLSESGDYSRAAAALEQAVEESPEYAEAHLNLSVQYVRAGRMDAAERELRRAIEIAGPTAIALCNLAWIQANTGDRTKAIETVRAGLKLDQSSPQGNLILGNLLAGNPNTRAEAITHLKIAAETLSSAKALLKQLHAD